MEVISIFAWVTLVLVLTSLYPALVSKKPFESRRHIFQNAMGLFRDPTFQALLLVWFTVGLAAYIYAEFYTNEIGIPMLAFIRNPALSRVPVAFWQWGKDNRITLLAIPLFVVVPMLYLAGRIAERVKTKIFFLSLSVVYPVATILKMSRIDFANIIIGIVFAEYYYRKFLGGSQDTFRQKVRKYWRYVLVGGGLFVLLLLGSTEFSRIRGGSVMSELAQEIGMEVDVPEPFGSMVVAVYEYTALPFENFANFYNSYNGGYRIGIGFFRPMLSLIAQGKVADEMLQGVDFNFQLLPANTYPFITTIYAEMGIFGVIVTPIVYGLFINTIYVRFRRRPNFVNFFVYVICPVAWLWIFAWPTFTVLTVYIYMAFTVALYWMYSVIARTMPSSRRLKLAFRAPVPQRTFRGHHDEGGAS
jgi:hypothetical protein